MFLDIFTSSVIAGLAGGVLSLDRTAAFQSMVSRPLVTGPVMGLFLGDVGVGLSVGVLLELIYMADRPVGSYVPVHETGLTVVVTAVSVALLKAMAPLEPLTVQAAPFMGSSGLLRVIVPGIAGIVFRRQFFLGAPITLQGGSTRGCS